MQRISTCAIISITLVSAVLAACSAATPVTSPPASPAVVPATAAPQAPAAAAPTSLAQAQNIPGFRRVVRNGEELFCQTRTPTGSRARTTEVCMTRADIKRMEDNNEDYWRNAASGSSHSTLKMDSP
jgi:hypothetical protein